MYLNNQKFYERLTEWLATDDEKVPDDIAEGIFQICTNLARSGRFAGYTWKDDMIGEAILDCIRSARKFNPERSSNPFAYFTQIAYNAFRRCLNSEHLRLATIENYKQSMDIMYDVGENQEDEYGHIAEQAKKYDTAFQKRYTIKRKKAKKSTAINIDDCFED